MSIRPPDSVSAGTPSVRLGRSCALLLLLVSSSAAWACPVCASETGRQIRAGIFDAGFVPTLLLVLAPFPALAGSVALVRRWVPE